MGRIIVEIDYLHFNVNQNNTKTRLTAFIILTLWTAVTNTIYRKIVKKKIAKLLLEYFCVSYIFTVSSFYIINVDIISEYICDVYTYYSGIILPVSTKNFETVISQGRQWCEYMMCIK